MHAYNYNLPPCHTLGLGSTDLVIDPLRRTIFTAQGSLKSSEQGSLVPHCVLYAYLDVSSTLEHVQVLHELHCY